MQKRQCGRAAHSNYSLSISDRRHLPQLNCCTSLSKSLPYLNNVLNQLIIILLQVILRFKYNKCLIIEIIVIDINNDLIALL